MAALAAVNSATQSLQSSLMRSRLEVAKREADQAQAEVNQLRSQMDQAESNYEKRQANVRGLQTSASLSTASPPAPIANQAPIAEQSDTTYIAQLSEVFQFAEPILEMDLSATQKNIVLGSLVSVTNAVQYTSQTNAVAVQRYSSQATSASTTGMGSVLNTTA